MNRYDLKERKNQEEMLAYAKQEGVELSDGQLETVSGGACETATLTTCYKCGQNSISPCRFYGFAQIVPLQFLRLSLGSGS